MTKLQALLLLLLVILASKLVQYWARRQVRLGKLAERKLLFVDVVLIACALGACIFLGMTAFYDWFTIRSVRIGIIITGTTVAIFSACPGKQAIRLLVAFGIWFALDTFRPWILRHLIPQSGIWTGILLDLILICLGIFIAYRLLQGMFRRLSQLAHRAD